jgi:ATP-dependent RNA helicase DeaD
LPPRINGIARHHQRDPIRIQIRGAATAEGQAPLVRQVAYLVPRSHKASALGRLLDVEAPTAALVFCRTREEVDTLSETLTARGYRAEGLHGGMTQEQRDRVMGRLRAGNADLIVATDVAARGLDVEQLTHVINYDVPSAPESYVHRIGRVGRAGRAGVAITLLEPRQHRLLKTIEKVTGQRISIEKIPTVADLRVRRLEITRSALHETLLEDDAEEFRVVVDTLTDDFDLMEVALAAVKLLHEATGGGPAEEEDIPDVAPRVDSAKRPAPGSGSGGGGGGARRYESVRAQGTTRIFVGVGRASKVRPQDLVGAIANETSLSGRQIGAIEIAHQFSIVEIPDSAVTEVIDALRATKIKGLRAKIDIFRPPGK